MAAVIPLHAPEEGIAELEHAKALGHKVAQIPAYVRRPVPDIAERYPEIASRVTYLDHFGIDSAYDYDPFWAQCVELGFAVAEHSGGMGFDDRRSISNYMYNHMGHFAAAGEVLCKSLLPVYGRARQPAWRWPVSAYTWAKSPSQHTRKMRRGPAWTVATRPFPRRP